MSEAVKREIHGILHSGGRVFIAHVRMDDGEVRALIKEEHDSFLNDAPGSMHAPGAVAADTTAFAVIQITLPAE